MSKQAWIKGVVWALLLAAVALWVASRSLQPESASQTLPEEISFKQADVHDIFIRRAASVVHLQHRGEQWFLLAESSPSKELADKAAVAHLLGDLSTMKIVRVVSHHADHFSQLGLDEKKGVHVRLLDVAGHVLLDIWVGKPASDLVSTYLRRQGSDASLAVDRSLTWQVRRLPTAWKAKVPPKVPEALPADHYTQPA